MIKYFYSCIDPDFKANHSPCFEYEKWEQLFYQKKYGVTQPSSIAMVCKFENWAFYNLVFKYSRKVPK